MIKKIVARFFKNATVLAALACVLAVLAAAAPVQAAGLPADITAQTWAVADADTGQILADHGGSQRMNPASITKVLTDGGAGAGKGRRRLHGPAHRQPDGSGRHHL